MFLLFTTLWHLTSAARQSARCAKCLDWIVFSGGANVSRRRRLWTWQSVDSRVLPGAPWAGFLTRKAVWRLTRKASRWDIYSNHQDIGSNCVTRLFSEKGGKALKFCLEGDNLLWSKKCATDIEQNWSFWSQFWGIWNFMAYSNHLDNTISIFHLCMFEIWFAHLICHQKSIT